MNVKIKDPDSILDYKVDWSTWLQGETIDTSTWIVPDGLQMETETNSDTSATIWLSGGTENQAYIVTNRIITSAGRTEDCSIKIRCTTK